MQTNFLKAFIMEEKSCNALRSDWLSTKTGFNGGEKKKPGYSLQRGRKPSNHIILCLDENKWDNSFLGSRRLASLWLQTISRHHQMWKFAVSSQGYFNSFEWACSSVPFFPSAPWTVQGQDSSKRTLAFFCSVELLYQGRKLELGASVPVRSGGKQGTPSTVPSQARDFLGQFIFLEDCREHFLLSTCLGERLDCGRVEGWGYMEKKSHELYWPRFWHTRGPSGQRNHRMPDSLCLFILFFFLLLP